MSTELLNSGLAGTELSGKVAIVTGGGSGIGAAIVTNLCAAGASVLAADRDTAALNAVVEATGCTPHEIDVTSEEENHAMVDRVIESFGAVDMAFLNAGILGRQREELGTPFVATDLDLDRYRAAMAVNVDAVVFGTVAVAAAMAKSGGGAIVATASTAGLVSWPTTPFYSATKHAVVGWVRSMADSLGSQGITVNAICPAGVATPLVGLTAEAAGDESRLLLPRSVATAAVEVARSDFTGEAVSVVAGRDDVAQIHPFNDVPGFP